MTPIFQTCIIDTNSFKILMEHVVHYLTRITVIMIIFDMEPNLSYESLLKDLPWQTATLIWKMQILYVNELFVKFFLSLTPPPIQFFLIKILD